MTDEKKPLTDIVLMVELRNAKAKITRSHLLLSAARIASLRAALRELVSIKNLRAEITKLKDGSVASEEKTALIKKKEDEYARRKAEAWKVARVSLREGE